MRITLLVATCCCALAPATTASPLDQASAHRALLGLRAYLKSQLAHVGAAQQAAEVYIQGIAAACPNVLAAVNQQPVTDQNKGPIRAFAQEAVADTDVATHPPLRPAVATLARKLRRLHWSSRSTGRRIRQSLTAEHRYLFLSPSDFCADASQLAADNAQTTPPATLQFLAGYHRATKHAGFVAVKDAVDRFRPPTDGALVKQVNRLNNRLQRRSRALLETETKKLLAAVGLTG